MPNITLQIGAIGPIIDIHVGISEPREKALLAGYQAVPPLVKGRALVDTGASSTCIDPKILASLQIPPRGTIPIHTPSTAGSAHLALQYDASLIFPLGGHNWKFSAIPIIECHLHSYGIDVLIGRDILDAGIFFYNGSSKVFTLSF